MRLALIVRTCPHRHRETRAELDFALAAAAALLILVLRRWSRSRPAPAEPPAATPPADDRYAERLRDALENLE